VPDKKTKLPEGGSRNLTQKEIFLAQKIFKDSIPYGLVKIHRKKWPGPWSPQSIHRPVAPNGNIYFHPKSNEYEDCFGEEAEQRSQLLFLHEMTHVWQKYRGGTVFVVVSGIPSLFGAGYSYKLAPGKKFSDYGLEAQASIIAHYYAVLNGWGCSANSCGTLQQYKEVLQDFFKNPSDRKNLPHNPDHPYSNY